MSNFFAPDINTFEFRNDREERLRQLMGREGFLHPSHPIMLRYRRIENLGYGLLHRAVEANDITATKFLIKCGVDIDDMTTEGNHVTPLDLAIQSHNTDMAKLLIENGASIGTDYIKDNWGEIRNAHYNLFTAGEDNIYNHLIAAQWKEERKLGLQHTGRTREIGTNKPGVVEVIKKILTNELVQNNSFNLNSINVHQDEEVFGDMITNDFKRSVKEKRKEDPLIGSLGRFWREMQGKRWPKESIAIQANSAPLSDQVVRLDPTNFANNHHAAAEVPNNRLPVATAVDAKSDKTPLAQPLRR